MARPNKSLGTDYFENMFQGSSDPWELETSRYEQDKYRDTIASLAGRRYSAGFEIGCAKGVLSLQLADCCASLLSVDISSTALKAARSRLVHLDHVEFEQMAFPGEAPDAVFDLIIMSEVAYYWDDEDLARAARWLDLHLSAGGDILLVHYLGETDYPQSGDEAVAKLLARLTIPVSALAAHRRPLYRLDLWRRVA